MEKTNLIASLEQKKSKANELFKAGNIIEARDVSTALLLCLKKRLTLSSVVLFNSHILRPIDSRD